MLWLLKESIPMIAGLPDLYRFNLWANLRLLDVCAELSDAQLDATTNGTFGSVRETLKHMLASEEGYARTLTGKSPTPRLEDLTQFPDFDELRRRVPLGAAQEVCAKAAAWRDDVVVPLRALRRRLKDGSPLVERGAAELFRTRIKAAELESERLQQEAMFALAAGLVTENTTTTEAAARANVAAYEQALAGAFAPDAVGVLLGALLADEPA